MCVGCREMKPKKELVRVVRTPADTVIVDFSGKASGRGAYLCPQAECLERAKKTRALERALERRITDDVWEKLNEEIRSGGE